MLALGRTLGERVLIGHNIVVTVLDIQRGKVRLGFEAPKDIVIAREEVSKNFKPKDLRHK